MNDSRDSKVPAKPPGTPAASSSSKSGAAFDDEEDEWRHDPVPPSDAKNPLDSLGKAVSDVVTSPAEPPPPQKPRS